MLCLNSQSFEQVMLPIGWASASQSPRPSCELGNLTSHLPTLKYGMIDYQRAKIILNDSILKAGGSKALNRRCILSCQLVFCTFNAKTFKYFHDSTKLILNDIFSQLFQLHHPQADRLNFRF